MINYGVSRQGFTLIELSVVLVIIGLIIGGILVGRDLVTSAAIRATITQVEKYNQAVNTFRSKYGALPGDMDAVTAARFGFAARGPNAGEGDGNGIIQGLCGSTTCTGGEFAFTGESGMFWVDLTSANGLNVNMIEGSFSTSTPTTIAVSASGTFIDLYLPQAKIGRGNYFYIWSGGSSMADGNNYFGVSSVSLLGASWQLHSSPGLTVKEAYNIDTKIDDGAPQSGKVQARYLDYDLENFTATWAAGGGAQGTGSGTGNANPSTSSTSGTSTTCFDNGGGSGVQKYSITQNNGTGINCALSFQFQ